MQLFFPEALWRRLPAAAPGRTLRISVTGHRRNRLSAEDSQQAEELLSETLETIGRRWPGEIMLLSGMADGSDLAAVRAKPDGWALMAVLAEPPHAFRHTVIDEERAEFDGAVSSSDSVILSEAAPDYAAVADYLVSHSDLMVAIWDGAPGKPGGTGSVVKRARASGLPVLHLPYPFSAGTLRLL